DVQLAADEPGRPFGAAREVGDALPGLRELEPHVLDRGGPERVRILLGEAHELAVTLESEPPREPRRIRTLEHVCGRCPNDFHPRKANTRPVPQITVFLRKPATGQEVARALPVRTANPGPDAKTSDPYVCAKRKPPAAAPGGLSLSVVARRL